MNDFFTQTFAQNPIENAKTLLQRSNTGDNDFYQAIEILTKLSSKKNLEAQLILAQVYMQKGALENATQKAMEIYQSLANTGQPHAMEALADLYLWGVGIDPNPTQAFQLYKQLSEMGFVPLTTLAYLYSQGVGTKSNEIQASTLILKSASQGDTLSFILLSERYLLGLGVKTNPNLAAAFATLAVKRKFPGAPKKLESIKKNHSINEIELNSLVNQLIKGIESFADKTEQLAQIIQPQSPEFAKKYLDLMESNNIDLNLQDVSFDPEIRGSDYKTRSIKNIKSITLSERHDVRIYKNLISFEECQYLIAQSQPYLKSTKDQTHINPHIEVDAFTGSSTVLTSTRPSPITRIVHQRFADYSEYDISHFEPASIIKYEVGDEYSAHTDAFVDERIDSHKKSGDFGGQRITTNLIYLLPADLGGETEYVGEKIIVKGEIGMGLSHSNVTSDGRADMSSIHVGKKIEHGQKWLFRTAVRESPLYNNNKIPTTRS